MNNRTSFEKKWLKQAKNRQAMKKYWFISYAKYRFGITFGHTVSKYHPFEWLSEVQSEKHPIVILSYQEITEEEYNLYNGKINE